MKTTILLLYAFGCMLNVQAQTDIYGRVTDKATREPLSAATVTLHRGTSDGIIDYAITDAEGHFNFQKKETANLYIAVTYLGYKKEKRQVIEGKEMLFELEAEAVTLKEVEIKGGRISMRQDTIKYDLSRFANSKDNNIKEVLKKLPGIDVDENSGKISYQGKAISHFFVEGMDVTGGSYNQVNENLKADAVESAEIIERFQPVRSLRNKVPTENVALNLKLKPEVRDKWIWNAFAGIGYGEEEVFHTGINALQLAKGKQGLYTYKGNHSGKDIATELNQLTASEVQDTDEVPSLIEIPAFSMPLEKERLLDNNTHLLSLNRIYRKDDEQQNRLSLRYLHDEQQRTQGTQESYFYTSDTIHFDNRQNHRQQTDLLRADWDYERNGEQSFIRNLLTFQGSRNKAFLQLDGDYELTQQIRKKNVEIENQFSLLTNKKAYTWGIRSYLHYTNRPSSLSFSDISQHIDVQQAYTDNHFYYLRKRNGWGIELTSGINGRLTFIRQTATFKTHRLQLYAHPSISWEQGDFRINITPDIAWEQHPNQQHNSWWFNPNLSLRYQPSTRWTFRMYAGLQHHSDSPEDFYPEAYRTDYRTRKHTPRSLSTDIQQNYTLYTEYKRPVKEFFWTLTLSHFNLQRDYLLHSEFKGKDIIVSPISHQNHTENYQAKSVFSKGFYDWNLKSSIEITWNYIKGIQAGQNIIQSYRSKQLYLKPQLNWNPTNWLSTTYQTVISRNQTEIGHTSELPALWNIQQQINIGIGFNVLQLNLSGEHYYNELTADESTHTWLADLELQYRLGKCRLTVSLNNLFNQQEYRYTTYSDIKSYTSWIKIRPRTFMVSIQWRW